MKSSPMDLALEQGRLPGAPQAARVGAGVVVLDIATGPGYVAGREHGNKKPQAWCLGSVLRAMGLMPMSPSEAISISSHGRTSPQAGPAFARSD